MLEKTRSQWNHCDLQVALFRYFKTESIHGLIVNINSFMTEAPII